MGYRHVTAVVVSSKEVSDVMSHILVNITCRVLWILKDGINVNIVVFKDVYAWE